VTIRPSNRAELERAKALIVRMETITGILENAASDSVGDDFNSALAEGLRHGREKRGSDPMVRLLKHLDDFIAQHTQ
jgi:hypothetical protein